MLIGETVEINSLHFFRWLDISFNRLSEIKNLTHLPSLQKIFLCANRISKIQNLELLANLTTLELGDNRIRVSGKRNRLVTFPSIYRTLTGNRKLGFAAKSDSPVLE